MNEKYKTDLYWQIFTQSLKMCNFHWKIQKFKNPFFIMLISFSINFKQFFFRISHLFFDFTPFFRTFFNFFFATARLLIHTNLLKKSKSIPITVLKFCLGTSLWHHTDARTHAQTNFWITIPRVGLKALELIMSADCSSS